MSLEELFGTVSFMTTPVVFQAAGQCYIFIRGIPQGCTLSSHFLNLYYGQLERELGSKTGPGKPVVAFVLK